MIFLVSHQAYAGTKPELVLLPLLGTGLNETEKQAFQTAIEDALLKNYLVYSGNQVTDALKKQTSVDCTAEYCMEQIAIEFQANLIARGQINKENNTYILTIKIKDVSEETHRVVLSKLGDCSACSIIQVSNKIKHMLSSRIDVKPPPVLPFIKDRARPTESFQGEIIRIPGENRGEIHSSKATVIIESQPDKADVYIGDTLFKQTPVHDFDFEAGRTILFTLTKKNYHPKTLEVTLTGGINDLGKIHLKPMFGTLVIDSDPSGADVFIAGQYVGKTPYRNQEYPSGAVLITVKKDLYKPVENKRVIISDEKTTHETIHLEKDYGVLIVESDPQPSDIKLYDLKGNVLFTDKTPCNINIRAGKYTLIISHVGYEDLKFQVPIVTHTTKRISKADARLRHQVGQIIVTSNPFKRGASIYINDEKKGKVPQTIQLPVGSYTVKVKYKNLTGSKKVHVRDRKTVNVDVNLGGGFMGESFTNSLGMTFVFIKPGSFKMGSPTDETYRGSDETQHTVILTKGYYLQTTEVTQGQWKAIMGHNPSDFKNCGENCPVESVSWDEVQQFIKKLNQKEKTLKYRLPTEAEWEYAARAGGKKAFANGRITESGCGLDPNLDRMGWYCGNSCVKYGGGYDCSWCINSCKAGTHPVAKKQPNIWGLYDMHGNVWEWCQDIYGEYPTYSKTDPKGPESGGLRVVRGGGWDNGAGDCRSANRRGYEPGSRSDLLGLRLAAFQIQQGDIK
jgi:formylglycine-generating enzyme required for sulfatase activity